MSNLYARLCERFCPPEWAIFGEVANGTGANHRRYADAVAMNLFPSRGLEVHGFECKISRGDWKRELDNPEKSCAVQGYCDRWWLVVSDAKIVKDGELPPTWGLMVEHKTGLRVVTQAPKLEAKALDRPFIAALLRRATENVVSREVVAQMVSVRIAEREKIIEERYEGQIAAARSSLDNLQRQVYDFEQKTGATIAGWRPNILPVTQFTYQRDCLEQNIQLVVSTAETILGQAKVALEALKKINEEKRDVDETVAG